MGCKSATIVGRLINGRLTAVKINGRYWMYWGEGTMHFATSADLVHWQPLENDAGKLRVSLNRRKGKFDSDLAEGGAAAILTDKGIVVIYNGKNGKDGDPSLHPGAYSGGQALFDPHDPTRLIARTDKPFFQPELPFEKTGQYGAGTTFLEGLVFFKGRGFLYYGWRTPSSESPSVRRYLAMLKNHRRWNPLRYSAATKTDSPRRHGGHGEETARASGNGGNADNPPVFLRALHVSVVNLFWSRRSRGWVSFLALR